MAIAITDSTPAASSLAPGFRFHPTDEELVRYYLRRKVCSKPFRFDAISDVDVYKVEPWDLPGLSKLKSRDLEWYFFSVLDKKYGNGSRTNRSTVKGYWKTTGKDRVVHHRSQQVGMKKTLVYHNGRAPKGERTNWVMHEYRLIDQELQKAGIVQDAFVLCRIFQKSGTGPKNGEKYGAPFIEEEWENDEYAFVPQLEDHTEELAVDKDSYLDANAIEQILNTGLPREDNPFLLTNGSDVSAEVTDGLQKSVVVADGYESQVVKSDGSQLFDPSVQTSQGYIGESSNTMDFGMDFLLDEPFFDATDIDFPLDDSLFFQADDFKNAVDMDSGFDMLNEYTTLFNPDVDNFQYTFDSVENKNDSMLNLENMNKGTHQVYESSQPVEGQNDKIASSSKKENPVQEADIAYPFLKKASYMLGNLSAPPALAAEFPTKYMTSASQASSAVNVTFSNVFFKEGVVDLPLGKHTQVNIVVSFGPGQRDISAYQSEKVVNAGAPRGWFYSSFLWISVLCFSFKIGSLVCSKSFMS
ncbi:NAC domain-containing protein 78-like [Bidens hawaiensis]|uniref:NAC domain-containing protein 78-like n=1 Tax=Bidens hawaiensis TaxID=980011 RepID=UPI00404AFB4D